ncbi:hypothetical protein [uncultured Thiodictyon sp.]|uniref:hypothetical protein n=1 Tax=uncultured Thiodictyon sp. TaxID=1846217 RepID=UPI0025FBF8F7|nr:hypothetical protein [uncultured Thiodictyon sp.]
MLTAIPIGFRDSRYPTNRLKTDSNRATYTPHKQRVKPVFGIIESVMGLRQFLAGSLDNV